MLSELFCAVFCMTAVHSDMDTHTCGALEFLQLNVGLTLFNILCVFCFSLAGYRQHCAKRRYISYLESNFEVFRPQGRHVAPMGVKFGAKEWTYIPRQISLISVQQ